MMHIDGMNLAGLQDYILVKAQGINYLTRAPPIVSIRY